MTGMQDLSESTLAKLFIWDQGRLAGRQDEFIWEQGRQQGAGSQDFIWKQAAGQDGFIWELAAGGRINISGSSAGSRGQDGMKWRVS